MLPGVTNLKETDVRAGTLSAPTIVYSKPIIAVAQLGEITAYIDTANYVDKNSVTCQIQHLLPGKTEWRNSVSVTWDRKSIDPITGEVLPAWYVKHFYGPPYPSGTSFRHKISLVGPGMMLRASFDAPENSLVLSQ